MNRIKYVIFLLRLMFKDFFLALRITRLPRNSDNTRFANLRTLCHILDKGLNINDFEKGHGKRVYHEALGKLNTITDSVIKSDPAFLWCISVIQNYENAQAGKDFLENINYKVYTSQEKFSIYEFMKSRVSSRNFLKEEIENYIWDEIVEIAIDAPNGCCKQPTRYYIINDQELIQSLSNNIAGSTGFGNFIPYLICVTADMTPYAAIDRFAGFIDASLSVENFVLAARANNIFSTILNWQHSTLKENKNVRELLSIPNTEQIILFIAAGYANKVPLKPARIGVHLARKM